MGEKIAVLDLSNAPSLLFLFGVSGSGKTYVGNLIARHARWPVYHADDDLTVPMKTALAEHRPFTDAMRNDYFGIVAERIAQRLQQNPYLVVTQGAYKQKHRDFLKARFPQIEFICVAATTEQIAARIQQRSQGIVLASAAALLRDFEPGPPGGKVLCNDDGEDSILGQLNDWYAPGK
jgi:carbohydrate kinase (thermoresistant glucokinase family)